MCKMLVFVFVFVFVWMVVIGWKWWVGGVLGVVVLVVGVGLLIGGGSQDSGQDTSDVQLVSGAVVDDGAEKETAVQGVAVRGTIYALGDSLTAGYGLPLEDGYPAQLEQLLQASGYAYEVVNGGKSGVTSAGLLAQLDWTIADAGSGDIAIIVVGGNDGLQSLPLDQLEDNIRGMIDEVMGAGVQVVLGGMQLPTNLDPVYRNEFAAIYPRLAGAYELPLVPFFLERVAAVPELNLPDGIHPTAEGHGLIADQVREFLVREGLVVGGR